uniref:Fatty acid desaturase domain-containing protein n=1 Tax=Timema monikensis TaxID=170555 RepID=A0A7R9E0J9_9NEOP|nr:unnamed protein product [Timema monikensis]
MADLITSTKTLINLHQAISIFVHALKIVGLAPVKLVKEFADGENTTRRSHVSEDFGSFTDEQQANRLKYQVSTLGKIYNTVLAIIIFTTNPIQVIKIYEAFTSNMALLIKQRCSHLNKELSMIRDNYIRRYKGLNSRPSTRTNNMRNSLVLDRNLLHSILVSTVPVSDPSRTQRLKDLREAHSSLCDIIRDINRIFGLLLLVSLLSNFMELIFQLYLSVLFTYFNWFSVVTLLNVYKIFIFAASGMFLMLNCDSASTEASETGVILQRMTLLKNLDQSTMTEIQLFLQQVTNRKVHFTAGRFFNLDRAMLFSTLGAVIAYTPSLVPLHVLFSEYSSISDSFLGVVSALNLCQDVDGVDSSGATLYTLINDFLPWIAHHTRDAYQCFSRSGPRTTMGSPKWCFHTLILTITIISSHSDMERASTERMYGNGPVGMWRLEKYLSASFQTQLVWKNIIGFTFLHLAAVYGLFLMLTASRIWTLVWAFSVGFLSGLGVTIGAHRLYSHRCFKATWGIRLLLDAQLVRLRTSNINLSTHCINLQNCLYIWVRDHRQHHKYSDTNADPHNAKRGFFFSHIGWLMMRKHPDVIEKGKYVDLTDLEADPIVMFQKTYYTPLYIVFALLLPVTIPCLLWGESVWGSVWTCFFTRSVLMLNITWLVNSAAHFYGTRPYNRSIQAVENPAVSFLCLGEGWHNYHHMFPWDYRAAEFGRGYDTSTRLIDFMARMGWVYDLRCTPATTNCLYIWVRDHRQHHKYSDTNADPHNAKRGFFFSHIGWLMMRKHPDVIAKGNTIDLFDLESDFLVMMQKRWYNFFYVILAVILPIGPPMAFGESLSNSIFVCFFFRYIFQLNLTWLVNSAAHLYGTKPYHKKIMPRENVYVALMSLGEGWHNYHHCFPFDYRASEYGNFTKNISAVVIKALAMTGLAYDLKSASDKMIRRRIDEFGDGSHPLWGFGDKDMDPEMLKELEDVGKVGQRASFTESKNGSAPYKTSEGLDPPKKILQGILDSKKDLKEHNLLENLLNRFSDYVDSTDIDKSRFKDLNVEHSINKPKEVSFKESHFDNDGISDEEFEETFETINLDKDFSTESINLYISKKILFHLFIYISNYEGKNQKSKIYN